MNSHENEAIVIPRAILDGRVAKSAEAIHIGAEKVCGDVDTQDRMMPFASKSYDVSSEDLPMQMLAESHQGAYQEQERQVRVTKWTMHGCARLLT